MLTAAQIREKYIQFFVERGHTHVSSSPVVPPDDPTMLFTSAGMVQFKPLYSGSVPLPYSRATTVQKCLRAGGKGSDLENVGVTLRHHTFFEMLGNFSFGDYFKREAITWAWEFCTSPQWLGLPAERLWPTIFGVKRKDGTWEVDHEAEEIWLKETGAVNPITRLNEKENFWGPAGETGACGPCSELCFFMGSDEELKKFQEIGKTDPDAIAKAICDQGDLFLEIWNLVFPQFDQQLDGSRPPLKNRGIDTGAGLERVTTVCQFNASGGKINSPYESDLMQPMVQAVSRAAGLPYPTIVGGEVAAQELTAKGYDPRTVRLAMNACADHIRALTFTLAEGVVPSNEGRGYVLRRILRRAARFGKKIGISEPFLWTLVRPVTQVMGGTYPEITKNIEYIEKTIRGEEERFNRALNQGIEVLEEIMAGLAAGEKISGAQAHRLHDTFGFPIDLTIEAAAERGLEVDREGFEKCLAESKAKARASWKGGAGTGVWADLFKDLTDAQQTVFTGYESTSGAARVLAIVCDQKRVESLQAGQSGVVVLDRTPFYAESGGQIGDTGTLTDANGALLFTVEDTQKTAAGYVIHFGEAAETVQVGQELTAAVNAELRRDTMANHSSVHLLQAALKKAVGDHVTQQGSFVGPEGMRFDFTQPEALSAATLREVETLVNAMICDNLPVVVKEMTLEEARKTGAIAPFGEKYGAQVRVVRMGLDEQNVSIEFCGGTHAHATGDLGLFVITGESSVASGIRRIEGKAGRAAFEHVSAERDIIARLSRRLSASPQALEERTAALQEEIKILRRQVEDARAEQARAKLAQAAGQSIQIGDVKLVEQQLDGADANMLAQAWDSLKNQNSTVGVFYAVAEGKVSLLVGVSDDLAPARLKAGDILKEFAGLMGGKGGGKPNLARGGAPEAGQLPQAVQALPGLIEKLLK